jgi:hypothetical protein
MDWIDDLIALIPTMVADLPPVIADVTTLIDAVIAQLQGAPTTATASLTATDKAAKLAALKKLRATLP